MSLGTTLKNQITTLIEDANYRSEITLSHITASNANFGYDGLTETVDSTETVYCIPSNYVKANVGLEKFGNLEKGDVRMLIKSEQAIDTNDKVTFQSDDWWIRSLNPIVFNNVIVAQAIVLTKRQ
jgi:hypothetical protein